MELKSRNMFLIITLGCLWVTSKATNQGKNTTACFCQRSCRDLFSIYCNADEHIFITRAQLGFKSVNNICSKTPSCQNCCRPETNDCFENYPESQLSDLYNNCWNHAYCVDPLQDRNSTCTDQHAFSTFPVTEHMCLKTGRITQFYMNSSINSSAVAIQYDPRQSEDYSVGMGHMKRWYCLVDSVSHTPCQVDVILVKDSYDNPKTNGCSLVGWSGGPSLSCAPAFQYRRHDSSTPFWVSVTVDGSASFPSGWAVVRAQRGEVLQVKCGCAHPPKIRPSDSKASTVQTSRTNGAKTSATMRPGGCAAALSNGNVSTPFTSSLPSIVTSSGSTVLTSQASKSASTRRSVKTTISLSSIPPTPTTQTTASSRQPSSSGTSQRPVWTVRPSTPVLATVTGFPPTSNENKPNLNGNADRSSGGSLNLGPLVGGIVAGVVVLAMGGLAVFCYVNKSRRRGTPSASAAIRDNTQVGVASTQDILMEQTSHHSQHLELMDPSSSCPADYVNASSSHIGLAAVYVNTASGRTLSSHAEPRCDNEQEYSSLDWSRDQANPYTGLKKT